MWKITNNIQITSQRDLPNSETLLLDSQIHNAEGLEVTNDSQETPEDSEIHIADELEVTNDRHETPEDSEIHIAKELTVTNDS